ncbi:MAG: NMD3-related protein [Candidatus Woesearchaeota archaeon]
MNKNPQYFEGVLQLRNPTQKIIDFVADRVEENEDVWIAKTVKHKTGLDLYMSSNKFLLKIGKRLKEKFPGKLLKTKTLFTQHRLTSKKVYRGCILFKNYSVKKGDVLDIRGDSIKVISVKKDIFGKNTKTNKKVHIRFDQLE